MELLRYVNFEKPRKKIRLNRNCFNCIHNILNDPGADIRDGTKILRVKSARVQVYKTSDKALLFVL